MYVAPNVKTKKALKERLAEGLPIAVYQPVMGTVPENGRVSIEGPHGYHRWYAEGTMQNGVLVKVT